MSALFIFFLSYLTFFIFLWCLDVVPLLDDDEFPALGCGRGAFKAGQSK